MAEVQPWTGKVDTGFDEDEKRLRARRTRERLAAVERVVPKAAEDTNIISDIGRGIGNGFVGFGQSIASLADSAVETFGGDLIDDELLNVKPFGETQTFVGGLFQNITQFGLALIPGAGVAGLAGRLGKLGTFGKAVIQGATADFLAFKSNEPRLSNMFEGTALENPVTSFLASNEEDSEVTGRLKNVVEGMGIGAAFDVLLKSLRGFKALKAAKTPAEFEAAKALVEQQVPEVVASHAEAMRLLGGGVAGSPDKILPEGASVYMPKPAKFDQNHLKAAVDALEVFEHNAMLQGPTKSGLRPEQVYFAGIESAFKGITEQVAGHSIDANEAGRFIDQVFNATYEKIAKVQTNLATSQATLREFATGFVQDTTHLSSEFADDLIAQVSMKGEQSQEAIKVMLKGKLLDSMLSRQAVATAKQLAAGELPEAARAAATGMLFGTMEQLGQLRTGLRRMIASSGRLLQAQNIKFKALGEGVDVSLLRDLEKLKAGSISGAAEKELLTRISLAGDNSKAIMAAVEGTGGMKAAGDGFMEYYVNALLSGPGTFSVNALGTGIQTVLLPFERALGGAIRGDMTQVREGVRTFSFMWRGMKDSLKAGLQTMKTGVSGVTGEVARRAISSEAMLGKDSAMGFLAPVVDFLGGVVRLPSRALGGADELFKQLAYRSEMYARLTDDALGKGILETGFNGKTGHAGVAAYVEQQVKDHFAGALRDEEGLRVAAKSTFQENFKPGSTAAHVQSLVNNIPGLRLFVPFIRTPINVLREAVGHTPLISQVLSSHKEALRLGGKQAAEITGKVAFGNMLFMMGTVAAMNGTINGSGGMLSRQERDRKMLSGWRPYSVKLGGTYVEFGRLDPLGVVLGLAADYAEIAKFVKPEDQKTIHSVMVAALTSNITNKTYLRGLSDVIDTLTDDDGTDSSNAFRRFAGSMVPSIMKTLADDPYLREARTVLDTMMSRTAASVNLMPRRNVLGEPIEKPNEMLPGLKSSADSKDRVKQVISSLPVSASAPVPRMGENIDLTLFKKEDGQTAYDRYQELAGTIKLSGKTLHESLAALLETPRYKALEVSDPTGLARAQLIERQLSRYRASAKKVMLKEFPAIREAVKQEKDVLVSARVAARRATLKSWLEQNSKGNN